MFVPAARNWRIAARTPAAPRPMNATPASARGQPPGTAVGQTSSRATPLRTEAKRSVGGLATTPGLSRVGSGKLHLEHGPAALARAAPGVAAVVARDLAHEREADAEAAVARFARAGRAVEGLEDPLALGLGHAGPAIRDRERGARARARHAHLDRRAAPVAAR